MTTPTVRKLQLGNELRRLREAAGKTPTEASKAIRCNISKISRLELGQSGIAYGDLKLLLEFYGDDPEHIDWMLELSRGNRERGRWSGHWAAAPDWFRAYVDLERDAEDIRWTAIDQVPGILQTEQYTRALCEVAPALSGDQEEVEDVLAARRERQEILHRSDPPTLSFILSEACVRQTIGNPLVMAEQLEHLLEVAAYPHVQLQLQPFHALSAPGVNWRFAMLRIPSPGSAPSLEFVYCEDLDTARFIDDKQAVRQYNALWNSRQAAALGPVETKSRLRELARQLTEGPRDDRQRVGLLQRDLGKE